MTCDDPVLGNDYGACGECRRGRLRWTFVPGPHEDPRGPGVVTCEACGFLDYGLLGRHRAKMISNSKREDSMAKVTTRPFVTQVSGNLKRGRFSVALGQKTLIVGANGRGKTSICNAVTLALVGFALDVGGRDMETKDADLFRHLSHAGEAVEARAVSSDGRTFFYSKEGGGKTDGAHLPSTTHKAVVPLAGMKDALTGAPQTVKKWLLDVSGRWMTAASLKATAASYGYTAILEIPDILPDVGAWLIKQSEAAEDDRRDAQKAMRAAESAIANLTLAAGLPVSDEEVVAANAAQAGATAAVADAVTQERHDEVVAALEAARADEAAAKTALDKANADAAEAEGAVRAWADSVASYPAPTKLAPEYEAIYQGLKGFLPAHRHTFTGACGLCGAAQADHAAYLARMDAMIAQVEAALNPADPAAEARKSLAVWQTEKSKRVQAAMEAQQVRARASAKTGPLEREAARPVAAAAVADEAVRSATYADILRRKAAHDQIAVHRQDIALGKGNESRATLRIDACKKLRDVLIGQSVKLLEQAVTKFLPEGEKFVADVSAATPRIGLEIGGVFRSGVSGAEEARMYAAVACALAGEDICVVMPAERQWSPETLREVMRALTDAPCQVILVSTVHPAGKGSKSWKVIDLDKDDAFTGGGGGQDAGDGEDTDASTAPEAPSTETQGSLAIHLSAPPWVVGKSKTGGMSVTPKAATDWTLAESYVEDAGIIWGRDTKGNVLLYNHPENAYRLWEAATAPTAPVLPPPIALPGVAPVPVVVEVVSGPEWLPGDRPPVFTGTDGEVPCVWEGDAPDVQDMYAEDSGTAFYLYEDGTVAKVAHDGSTAVWPAAGGVA